MQYDDKLITLDNLGTFKGKMEGEIDKASHDLIADGYDATKTYEVGDVVLHGGFLYECDTAIAQAEEWDPTKWTQINLAEYCRNVAKIGYIELSGRSGSLTDAQIAELKKPECIAKLVRDSNTTYIFSSRLVSTLSNLCQFIYTDIGSSAISVNYTKLYLTCRYDAKTYQLTTDAKSLYWKEQIDTLLENTIASQYSSSETYDVGDYCLYKPQYDWKLYRCTAAVTVAEPFDRNKWEEVKVTDLSGGSSGVMEVEDYASLPTVGEAGIIYITKDTNRQYRWTGTAYVELSAEDEVEVIEFYDRDVINLTEAQLKKLYEGKLALKHPGLGLVYSFMYVDTTSNKAYFRSFYTSAQSGSYVDRTKSIGINIASYDLGTKVVTRTDSSVTGISDDYRNFFDSNVDPVANGKRLVREMNLRKTQDMITPNVFDATATYAVGDVVIYQNDLYECNTAIETAEAWTAAHWTKTSVIELAQEKGAYIVEVTGTGTQTEAKGAEIEKADALLNTTYGSICWKRAESSNSIEFMQINSPNSSGSVTTAYYTYNKSTRALSYNQQQRDYTQYGIVAPEFSESTNYSVGDLVWHYHMLYRCTAAHSAGAWDSSHFTQTTVSEAIKATEQIGLEVVELDIQYVGSSTGTITDTTLLARMFANPQNFVIHRSGTEDYYLLKTGKSESIRYDRFANTVNGTMEYGVTISFTGNWVAYNKIADLSSKQNKLTFNPTVPSGTTTTPLTGIQDGSNYYGILNSEQFHPAYDSTKTYAIGDMVSYSGKFYICTTAISTAEDWTDGHWTETKPDVKVIDISGTSGTLTDEQFALVNAGKCIFRRANSTSSPTQYGYYLPYISNIGSNKVFKNLGITGHSSDIQVNDSYIDVGSNKRWSLNVSQYLVKANPSNNSGSYLEGLQVGTTLYKIPANANANIAPDYDATATYDVGDCVIYGGVLYECSTAITVAEAWDATHWTQVKVTDLSNESEMEIINYQTSTALTDLQVEKLKLGKAVVYYEFYQCFLNPYQILQDRIKFIGYCCQPYQSALYVPDEDRYVRLLTELMLSTKIFSGISSNNPFHAVNSASAANFFSSSTDPTSDGKKLVREQNIYGKIIPTYSSSDAGKVVRVNSSGTGVELDETATELEINRLFRTKYTITSTITNGSASGDKSIWVDETASVTITPSSGYVLPTTIAVSGATYSYDNSTGIVSLSAATGAVSITAICPPPPPNKGDIITLDGGTARYRVLKTNGNVAEVFALDDVAKSVFNYSSVATTFSDGSTGQKYENSNLDTYMNSTFYNSLSANIKAAIVQKAITQSMYQFSSSEISGYDFAMIRITSETYWYKRKGQVSVGNRYCYALDIDDVAEYLGAGSGNTVSGADINNMFFEQTTTVSKAVWLDSAESSRSVHAFYVSGGNGYVNYYYYDGSYVARPAFQVDLSKVSWSKE